MQIVILTTNTDPYRLVRYLGPYQIAYWTRKNGYPTQVLDFLYHMTKEERLKLFQKFITRETKIVGYSPFIIFDSFQYISKGKNLVFEILEEIKENFPWVKIVLGGPFTRSFLEKGNYKNLSFKLDAVFKGEGEHSFLEYCDHILKDGASPKFTLYNENKLVMQGKTYDIENCGMVFSENDFIMPGETLPFEMSRGCIFKCSFCMYPNIGKKKDDFNKKMSSIEESLLYNYEKFGTTIYHLADDTINSHRQRTKDLHQLSKTLPFQLEFLGYTRLDLLDVWPEQQDILPEAGLRSVHFGIESLDPYSCKMIGKGWGGQNHKKWLKYILEKWKDDVTIMCSLIAGLGNETESDWQRTDEWFRESGVHDWGWQPLHLKKKNLGDVERSASIFEQDPEKYGYRMREFYGWDNDHTNVDQAKAFARTSWIKNYPFRKATVWKWAGYLNLGFTREELKILTYPSIEWRCNIEGKTKKFVESYLEKAMNY
jgi:radical SAM superfamily enzyme YgiQ (UPF0313 family)